MMRCRIRLLVTLALGLLVAPLTAEAQPASRLPRIGFLGNSTAALEANLVGPFRDGLRDLGYVEGENILLEYRWAEGKYERFPELISCSGLRTGHPGLANTGGCGPAICANPWPRGPTLIANEPTLVCERLANTPVGQHALRMR
jgi:hypothetical protein